MIQMHALYVFLAVAGLLIGIFIYVASSTRHARDIDSHAAYGIRTKFFLVLLGVLVIGLGLTLGKTPYPKNNEIPRKGRIRGRQAILLWTVRLADQQ